MWTITYLTVTSSGQQHPDAVPRGGDWTVCYATPTNGGVYVKLWDEAADGDLCEIISTDLNNGLMEMATGTNIPGSAGVTFRFVSGTGWVVVA